MGVNDSLRPMMIITAYTSVKFTLGQFFTLRLLHLKMAF